MSKKSFVALFLGCVLLLWAGPPASANTPSTIIYVDWNASGDVRDGTSWSNAYHYLSQALSQATAGVEIWVAQGYYYPDEGPGRTNNDPNQWFIIPSGVQIYGGFAGGETSLAQRDWTTYKTILSGDIDQNDVNLDDNWIDESYTDIRGTNANSIIDASNTDDTTRLDGFVITGGNSVNSGGGIYAAYSSAGFYNLEIVGNRALVYGGGLYDGHGSPHVEHVVFSANYASGTYSSMGGGMAHIQDGNPVLIDVTFRDNESFEGGGLAFQGGYGTIKDCNFTNNRTVDNGVSAYPGYGGGFSAWDAAIITFDHVVFKGNQGTHGGGMYLFRSGWFTVTDSVFDGNSTYDNSSAGDTGGGIAAGRANHVTVANTLFVHNVSSHGGGFGNTDPQHYTLINCVFTGNQVRDVGGALWNGAGGHGSLTNVTFNANEGGPTWGGGAIGFWSPADGTSSLTIANSILWGDTGGEIQWYAGYSVTTPAISYSDVQGGWAGTGNINVDPLFNDAAGHDMHLGSGSPAIDAGDNTSVPLDALDLDGDGNTTEVLPYDLDRNGRLVDDSFTIDTGNGTPPIVDMGAYEYTLHFTPTILLESSLNPSLFGQTVTLTATASGTSGTPSGNITFKDGESTVAGCESVALEFGVAQCEMSDLSVGTHPITALYPGDGTYGPADDSLDQIVGGTAQTITFENPGPQSFGTSPTLTATATSNLDVTFTSSTPTVCTITAGGTLTFVSTGTCSIDADQPGGGEYMPAPTVNQEFSVNPVVPAAPLMFVPSPGDAEVTVYFDPPAFDGGAPITSYTATSDPGGLTGTVTSQNPITIMGLTNGTSYTFTVTATNSVGTGPPSAPSVPVTPKAPQTITFANPGNQYFGTSPTLEATADSGLPVTLTSLIVSVCTINDEGTLTFLKTGICSIRATQPGNDIYRAATPVARPFTVLAVVPGAPTDVLATAGNAEATVTFSAPAFDGGAVIGQYAVYANPGPASAIGDASPIIVSGLTNGTSYTFTIKAYNSVGYGPESEPSNSVTPKTGQTITFDNPGAQSFGMTPTLTATASSSLPVTFTSSTPGVCTITPGGLVTFLTVGTCTINADQAGNATWAAADTVTQSFTVDPGTQTIDFGALAGKTYGDADFAVSATASSGLDVTFESSLDCTVAWTGSSWMVTIKHAGSCTLTASQAGNDTWSTAAPVEQSFDIDKADADCSIRGYRGVYDGASHGASGSCTGVNGDTFTGTHSSIRATKMVASATPVSSLDLGATFANVPGGSASWHFWGGQDYEDQSGSVDVEISPMPVTVTADNQTKTVGQTFTFTGLEFSHGSLAGVDDISSVTLTSAGAVAGAVAGDYPIIPSDAVFSAGVAGNYDITYVNGVMTVNAVVLTVTPYPQTVQHSDPNPAFTFEYSGFTDGDTASVLTTQPTCGTTRTLNSSAGNYPIVCTGGVDDKYTFSYVQGALTVTNEGAAITYTGDTQITTSRVGASATVRLATSLEEDLDGLVGESADGMKILFEVFGFSADPSTDPPITSCMANVGSYAAGRGQAGCTVSLSGGDPYQVKVSLVTNLYHVAAPENMIVLVNDPGSGMTVGGGWLFDPNLESRSNFGFSVKFLKNGKVQGSSIYRYRLTTDLSTIVELAPAGERSYDFVVKGNAMSGLSLYGCAPKAKTGCKATFSGKNTVQAVDRLTGIAYSLGGNFQFQVDVSDNREANSKPSLPADEYAIRVWKDSGIWFVSAGAYDDNGLLIDPLAIGGGNIQVTIK